MSEKFIGSFNLHDAFATNINLIKELRRQNAPDYLLKIIESILNLKQGIEEFIPTYRRKGPMANQDYLAVKDAVESGIIHKDALFNFCKGSNKSPYLAYDPDKLFYSACMMPMSNKTGIFITSMRLEQFEVDPVSLLDQGDKTFPLFIELSNSLNLGLIDPQRPFDSFVEKYEESRKYSPISLLMAAFGFNFEILKTAETSKPRFKFPPSGSLYMFGYSLFERADERHSKPRLVEAFAIERKFSNH